MSLLKLSNIGKIYVSGDNVAVGIRGVNLEFDIGEFVAITGKSGSGKTTLLNVISGMDTYEEGELYVEGEPTSHFDQTDWEQFRQKYISFIFQDYNIIESFTVLQNVELALPDSMSASERKTRALELIERVGLTKFKNHKGSKLSGGQKQRTVIARALAKDSPIILADEPTGNLDSVSAKEIVNLLKEISEDKLVIVVTHNFDELKDCATREVRIFDGSVERDEQIRKSDIKEYKALKIQKHKEHKIKKGFELAFCRFTSTPRLSIFTCIVMALATIGCFLSTSLIFQGSVFIKPDYLINHIDGRVVIAPKDGSAMDGTKVETIATETGAQKYFLIDDIFDYTYFMYMEYKGDYHAVDCVFSEDTSIKPSIGRKPENADEALLYLPIEFQPIFGKRTIETPELSLFEGACKINIVGVKYYYDNQKPNGKIILTEEGFEKMTYFCRLFGNKSGIPQANFTTDNKEAFSARIFVDNSLTGKQVYFNREAEELDKMFKGDLFNAILQTQIVVRTDEYYYETRLFESAVQDLKILKDKCTTDSFNQLIIYTSPELAIDLSNKTAAGNTQSTIIFDSDSIAESKLLEIRSKGYDTLLSNSVYNDSMTQILTWINVIFRIAFWIAIILFIGFFLSVCTGRAIVSKISDVAILRSMGIKVRTIKLSLYIQMLFSCIPSLILLSAAALLLYTNPITNPMFPYLYWYEYLMIVVGIIFMSFIMTKRLNKKMFKGSVRKTMKSEATQEN